MLRKAIALGSQGDPWSRDLRRIEYETLGWLLRAEGKGAEADACQQVVKAAELAQQADTLRNAGSYSQAAELYRLVLSSYPADGDARMSLAYCLENLGRHGEAVAENLKALELLPGAAGQADGLNPFEYGVLHTDADRQLARTALEKLKQAHPRDPAVLVGIAEFDSQVGDDDGALASYEAATALDPRDFQAWEGIASLWQKGVVTAQKTREVVLTLIALAPLTWDNYDTGRSVEAFSDKAPLWRAYRKALPSPATTPPKGPLFPLDASKRSLAAGTRPVQPRSIPSTSMLGDLGELRVLYP